MNNKISEWIKKNRGLMINVINKEIANRKLDVEFDDIYQIACIGVMMGFKALENKPLNCAINTAMVYRIRSYIGLYYRTEAKHEKLIPFYDRLSVDIAPEHESPEHISNIHITLSRLRRYIISKGEFTLMDRLDALIEHSRGNILLETKTHKSYLTSIKTFCKHIRKGVII